MGTPEAGKSAALTDAQQALVAQNLGLVALHIRRNVRNLGGGRGNRDFDDLFQEGCCGLIQAARTFDPQRGIPFAAFALPRIHTAVSTALYENASLVRTPRRRQRRCELTDDRHAPDGGTGSQRDLPARRMVAPIDARVPRVGALEFDPPAPIQRGDPAGPTIGERIREKYERAVELAARRALVRRGMRADRAGLVRLIVDERLRVAEETERRALRQIARETGSSYSRVLQCERKLQAELRRVLASDLEFRQLRAWARRSSDGHETPVDGAMQDALRALAAEEFWRKLNLRSRQERAVFAGELSVESGDDVESAVRRKVAALPPEIADDLLARVGEERKISARRSRRADPRAKARNADIPPRRRRSSDRCPGHVRDRAAR